MKKLICWFKGHEFKSYLAGWSPDQAPVILCERCKKIEFYD